jgi:16S rRNA G966 N2-methylase RsmD
MDLITPKEKIECAFDEMVAIHKLVPNPKNPNKHPDRQIEMLAKIIDYQGQRSPIVVSSRSGFIVKGHGRLAAIQRLGWENCAVDFQHYEDEAQEFADMVADNKISELAEHDDEMFKLEALNLQLDVNGFDLDLLGVPDLDLSMPTDEQNEMEDSVPEVTESISKLGDLYEFGGHRLLCGDSTDKATVEMLMAGEKADMVFTDPPYGVGYKYNSHNDDVTKEQHTKFLDGLIKQSLSLSGRFILTPGCKNLDTTLSVSSPSHVGCWTKTNAMSPGRITHFWTWEPIFFYGKWERKRGNDVFNFPVGKQPDTGDHTCPKPIALWQDIVENFSDIGELIIDLFGGSGSTLIACEKTKRKCFMMELDPHYVDVIVTRWCKYTNQTKIKRNGETVDWVIK